MLNLGVVNNKRANYSNFLLLNNKLFYFIYIIINLISLLNYNGLNFIKKF